MWHVKPNPESHDRNFGPDYGVDYARLSDPPDIYRDEALKFQILSKLDDKKININVKNGFVFLKGSMPSGEKSRLIAQIRAFEGVRDIIFDTTMEDDDEAD